MSRGRLNDRYPQLLTAQVVQAVANEYEVVTVPLPVPRYGGSASRPFVFELVRAFIIPTWTIHDTATAAITIQVSTLDLGEIDFADPRVFIRQEVLESFTTSGATIHNNSFQIDFCVGDRGLLIGTDNIYLAVDTGVTQSLATVTASFEYRLITVSASEYIGIVQSQQ